MVKGLKFKIWFIFVKTEDNLTSLGQVPERMQVLISATIGANAKNIDGVAGLGKAMICGHFMGPGLDL